MSLSRRQFNSYQIVNRIAELESELQDLQNELYYIILREIKDEKKS